MYGIYDDSNNNLVANYKRGSGQGALYSTDDNQDKFKFTNKYNTLDKVIWADVYDISVVVDLYFFYDKI